MSNANLFRKLPSVDVLLRHMSAAIEQSGKQAVTTALRGVLTEQRSLLAATGKAELNVEALCKLATARLTRESGPSLTAVFNLTGTVLHTNLGRAVIPDTVMPAIEQALGNCNLEFDLADGERGDRDKLVEPLICELTGAESATVVNNNAAAVLLVLNTLALNKSVPVSRGELVEIGGSFRIPEMMERSGCRLLEIGATNRTHLRDYAKAITAETALLLKVHTSNYRIQGFTNSVSEAELAHLAHEHSLPLVVDMGSGNLLDFQQLGLPSEPRTQTLLAAGADIITFSGDKLLGGPQAGLIAGRRDLIEAIKRNPLKRALRADKVTLATLAAVLNLYRHPDKLLQALPTLRHLKRSSSDITTAANRLRAAVQASLGDEFLVSVKPCDSQIGSGAVPLDTLPSAGLHITRAQKSTDNKRDDAVVRELARQLRALPHPVIGRIHRSALWLDLRCLETAQEPVFLNQLALLQQ